MTTTAAETSDAHGEPHLRVAHFDELDVGTLYAILRLRIDVFVVEQYCHFADLDGRDTEPTTRHVWFERDGEVLAYARLLADTGGCTVLGRVVTHPAARGSGIGARLVTEAVRLAGGPVRINAQAQLAPWYERLGFVITGRFFYEDNMPHFPMRHDPPG